MKFTIDISKKSMFNVIRKAARVVSYAVPTKSKLCSSFSDMKKIVTRDKTKPVKKKEVLTGVAFLVALIKALLRKRLKIIDIK